MLAHRGWRFTNNGKLWSLTRKTAWEGPVFHADKAPYVGPPREDDLISAGILHVPAEDTHGIYAFKERPDPPDPRRHYVTGTVELYGTVVEHERGYRAEHAIVRSLHFPSICPCSVLSVRRLVRLLADRYDCEVTCSPMVDLLEREVLADPEVAHASIDGNLREEMLKRIRAMEHELRKQMTSPVLAGGKAEARVPPGILGSLQLPKGAVITQATLENHPGIVQLQVEHGAKLTDQVRLQLERLWRKYF